MTSRLVEVDEMGGYDINGGKGKPIIEDAMKAFINQVESYGTHYTSGTTIIRFDLALPDHMADHKDPAAETELISAFFKKLKERLGYKTNGDIKKMIYAWVREVEKAKKGHFHCYIGLPHRQVRAPGVISSDTHAGNGTMGLIEEIWDRLTDGGRVWYSKTHRIKDDASRQKAIYHISYLAKVRGKTYAANAGHRNWGSSRLAPAA
jgi:hypothetical protein